MEIKQIRKALGLTQQELAEKIGVTVGVISRWERKLTHPSRLAQKVIDKLENKAKKE